MHLLLETYLCTISATPMRMRHIVATGIFLFFLLPATSFAASDATQAYKSVTGPFDTQEEAQAACMEAVGLDAETVRLYTGNIGHFWRINNPLRFLVRRCLNNVKKQEENRARGERTDGRRVKQSRRILAPRSQAKIQQTRQNLRQRTYRSVRARANQQTRSARQNVRRHTSSRSLRRVDTRANERAIRQKLEKKRSIQKAANKACRDKRGQQRVMCIRKEVGDREEALYEE